MILMGSVREVSEMSRYIEADKVLKELHLNYKDVIYIDKNDTAKRIKKIQSIDIVRCKECKCFNHFEDKEHGEWNTCERHMIFMNPDDFCSYGEREGE